MNQSRKSYATIAFTTLAILTLCILPLENVLGQRENQQPSQKKGGEQQKKKGGGEQQKKKGGGGPKHIFTGPVPAHDFDVILARPTDKSVTVSVLAYDGMDAYVSYGKEASTLNLKTEVRSLRPDSPAEFLLENLVRDTQYFYQMYTKPSKGGEFTPKTAATFHTQRKPGSAFTFTIQSDSHLDQGTRPALYERTLANALADKTDFHIDIGDTFMTDKYDRYQDAYPQYLAQRYYLGQLANSAAFFMALGNHDGERLDRYNGTTDCMSVWSCLARKKLFPNPYPDGFYSGNQIEVKHVGRVENYYAWEWGDALFVVLDPFWNTNQRGRNNENGNWARTLGDEQYRWLETTLGQSKAKFKFIFIHHLVGGLDESARGGSEAALLYEWGGKGKGGEDEFKAKRPGWSMPIHQLLVKNRASAVFHGHDHFFAKQDLDGIAYVMLPQPGHPGFDRLRNVEEYGYEKGDFMPPAGHIRVKVSEEEALVEYVRSYLPESENAKRKNGEVGYSFRVK